ncbi:protein SCO1 homolog 2, mitochondrial isoform X1 [Musa acuminata AAA Group]|uniref:protein SCO1 homolog 2, mitochondrial isoform X1 n=1 Tax=Musa acuminata AAA Group TaxID=214697 RepID=UPI0031D6D807
MIRSALCSLSLRSALNVSSPSPWRPRFYPSQKFEPRCYTNGSNFGNHKLPKQVLEDDEPLASRSWIAYVIPTAVLLIAGTGLYVHYNDEKRAILKGSEQSIVYERNNVNRPAIGGPFKLFDTENNSVTESTFQGNWVLMYFGYTSSPDVGPEEVKKMADVIKVLESEYNFKIKPVFISIDPQRDTCAQVKAYLKEFDPRIIGLTGPVSSVRQAAQEYRVFFRKVDEEGQDYLVESSNNMYLLDPNTEVVRFFGVEYDARQLADAIMMEVNKASR